MWHGLGLAIELILTSFFLSLWIWSFLHCAGNRRAGVEKTPWLLLIFFLPIIGCPVYFFIHGRAR